MRNHVTLELNIQKKAIKKKQDMPMHYIRINTCKKTTCAEAYAIDTEYTISYSATQQLGKHRVGERD